jgi:MipA family protein
LRLTLSVHVGTWLYSGCALAILWCGRASAQEELSPEEVAVAAERQTALESEALTISETPDAGPHLAHSSAIVGFGPMIAPAYDGSKRTKVRPFPYVDVRGLFDDRVFVSIVEGIGLKLLNEGPIRAGVTVNYSGGRTSSDDPRLKGLADIGGAAQVGGYMAYAFRPFAIEAKVEHRLGSASGTQISFGGGVSAAPIPQLHISLSADVTWADTRYQKTFFGVTAAEAAQATAQGNPLTAYTPGSGLTSVGLAAAGVYQVGDHWGLVVRMGLHDLVGKPAKDSPLTQRTFQPNFAVGAIYKF